MVNPKELRNDVYERFSQWQSVFTQLAEQHPQALQISCVDIQTHMISMKLGSADMVVFVDPKTEYPRWMGGIGSLKLDETSRYGWEYVTKRVEDGFVEELRSPPVVIGVEASKVVLSNHSVKGTSVYTVSGTV